MANHPILDDHQYRAALDRLEALWDAAPGSPEEAELDRLADQIQAYERPFLNRVLPPSQPGPLIDAKRLELGLTQNALARRLGWTSGRLSEVVNGKRDLTLRMVRDLVEHVGMDAYVLLRGSLPEDALWLQQDARALLDRLALRDGVPREVVVARALTCYAEAPAYRPPVNTFAAAAAARGDNVLTFSDWGNAA